MNYDGVELATVRALFDAEGEDYAEDVAEGLHEADKRWESMMRANAAQPYDAEAYDTARQAMHDAVYRTLTYRAAAVVLVASDEWTVAPSEAYHGVLNDIREYLAGF